MEEIKLTVRPFLMGTDKEAALKPLEEASEVRAAWAEIDKCGSLESVTCRLNMYPNVKQVDCQFYIDLADEIADCIQACCNLADRYGIDLGAALARVEEKNRARGRYE